MRVFVLDSALGRCTAAVVIIDDGVTGDGVVAMRAETWKQGHEAVLPLMARDVLTEAGGTIDCIGVTIGPGSFTGIRAGLALAHGIGLAAGVPVIGVTVGEAIALALPDLNGRTLWTVTDGRRGHVFLERGVEAMSFAVEALPQPPGKLAIAGGAAKQIAARLAARDVDVLLTEARFPSPHHIAVIAAQRHAGLLPPRDAYPLYIDPPQAKLPANAPRPPPQTAAR